MTDQEYILTTYLQQWDFHYIIHFTYLYKNTNEYICSFEINIMENNTTLNGVYVNDKFRNNGMLSTMITDFKKYIDKYINTDVTLQVRKDNFVYQKYLKYGFEFLEECDFDSRYDYLIIKKITE